MADSSIPIRKRIRKGKNDSFEDDFSRFVLFPISHDEAWEFYKKALASFWTTEEIDLTKDLIHWKNNLKSEEKDFIKLVLAFFSASDGIVTENLALRFYKDIDIYEIRCFYGFQIAIENIHAETYGLLIDTFFKGEEKQKLFQGIENYKTIKKKAKWALKWIESNKNFAERLVAFACVEGIFFSSSFCAIFWLKKRGLMPGLCFSNELISRDEGLHTQFACFIYKNYVVEKLPRTRIYEIVDEAVKLEINFVNEALKIDLLGINSVLMGNYVKFVADYLLTMLDIQKFYNVENPFDWMNLISIDGKSNFFELRVGEYKKAGVSSPRNSRKNSRVFTMDEDF